MMLAALNRTLLGQVVLTFPKEIILNVQWYKIDTKLPEKSFLLPGFLDHLYMFICCMF